MFYATWSEGFRPGGVNRRGTFPPYKADFLTNYELGWKTSWADNRLRFNGAVFKGDWDDFQFSFLGENGLTNISNAGNAKLEGIEMDVQWAATDAFTLYGGLAIQKAELGEDFCKSIDPLTGDPFNEADCIANEPADFAPDGTRLPTTPEFKASLTGRYEFQMNGLDAHFQASVVHNGEAATALLPAENDILGDSEAYTLVDFSFGFEREKWSAELFIDNVFDERVALYRYSECDVSVCSNPLEAGIVYGVVTRPRMVGLKFSQKF
jgi:outer membrane receptor protein involved in Fe transport